MTDLAPAPPAADEVGPAVADLETIVSLSKRRGFIFPSSEIYGGINAVWDYGPLGVELKNNVKRAWWRAMVQERDDIVGLDAGILMHPQVWVTSGHVGSFSDPLVECQTDHRRFRLDELPGAENLTATRAPGPRDRGATRAEVPGRRRAVVGPRQFNLMFKTLMGPIEEDASVIYLRPETAQGSYVNFKNVQQSSARSCHSGSPRSASSSATRSARATSCSGCASSSRWRCSTSSVRTRPRATFEEWLPRALGLVRPLRRQPVAPALPRARAGRAGPLRQEGDRRRVPLPVRLEGAQGHPQPGRLRPVAPPEARPQNLGYLDQATGEHFIPWIVETAAEPDRAAFTFLIDAYREEEVRGEKHGVARAPSRSRAVPSQTIIEAQ